MCQLTTVGRRLAAVRGSRRCASTLELRWPSSCIYCTAQYGPVRVPSPVHHDLSLVPISQHLGLAWPERLVHRPPVQPWTTPISRITLSTAQTTPPVSVLVYTCTCRAPTFARSCTAPPCPAQAKHPPLAAGLRVGQSGWLPGDVRLDPTSPHLTTPQHTQPHSFMPS